MITQYTNDLQISSSKNSRTLSLLYHDIQLKDHHHQKAVTITHSAINYSVLNPRHFQTSIFLWTKNPAIQMPYEKKCKVSKKWCIRLKRRVRKGPWKICSDSSITSKDIPWISKLLKHSIKLSKAAWINPHTVYYKTLI